MRNAVIILMAATTDQYMSLLVLIFLNIIQFLNYLIKKKKNMYFLMT